MAIARETISKKDLWNVEDMYASFADWEKEFELATLSKKPRWPELVQYKGKLGDSPENLRKTLVALFDVDRKIGHLYTYAHLRHDEDIAHDEHKSAYGKITGILHDFQHEISWFEPELLSLPKQKIEEYLKSDMLSDYHFYLEKIFRVKPHILSEREEELLAMAGKSLQASHKSFSAINDADFKFGTVKDSENHEHGLTHGSYGLYLRSHDRQLRKNTYFTLHGKYQDYENTLTELLQGQTQAHFFNAKARNYSTCLEAALFPKNIDTEVYHALIKAVHEEIGMLHRYVALRKKCLNVGDLHLYDMNVPLTSDVDIRLSYEEAEALIIESVAPLGTEYQEILRKGFKEQGWVDRYENNNKRSGAYSSGCYDSLPYILMNYKELLRDAFTLAHEAGHSMHSFLTHKNQPYQYGDYPIFLAEVASTFNEELLMQLMLKRAKNKEEKIFLLTQKLEDIRGTLFRQTMFAEFELLIHGMVEKNIPMTPKLLKEEYKKLNTFYFGDDIVIDPEGDIEWARIPHFYYNFYVYQYATGISAALALVDRVVKGGTKEREDYLNFLKGGSSRYPIEMLRLAGVDMRSSQPVKATIAKFGKILSELEELLAS